MGKTAVVLHSGGLDSTLCLARALKNNERVIALSLVYGQKNIREQLSAIDVVKHYFDLGHDVSRKVVDLTDVWEGTESALISNGTDMQTWTPEKVATFRGEAETSVQFRNGVFIAVGVAQAMMLGAEQLWVGMTGQGANQYADCSPSFCRNMFEAAYVGSRCSVNVVAPLNTSNKVRIVGDALHYGIPIGLTWTCYGPGPIHCGTCLACVERREAFKTNGVEDLVEYEN